MNKIKINNLKAFSTQLTLDIKGKNLLIYGENGAGKSSIFEAIKIIFFKDKMIRSLNAVATPEEQTQIENDFWESFNNRKNNKNFEISINEQDYKDFDSSRYLVYMISHDNLVTSDSISLVSLLSRVNFTLDLEVEDFCSQKHEVIQNEINDLLKEFNEYINVEIDPQNEYKVVINDPVRGIRTGSELKKFFNEAKLNLILLLVLFSSIHHSYDKNNELKKILVLDDFITSLDIANRTFLTNFLLLYFEEFQKVILTHNVYYFNLFCYFINDFEKEAWVTNNLYEIGGIHKLLNHEIEDADAIQTQFEGFSEETMTSANIEDIGNKIRKRFEVILYQLSKILMIGSVSTSEQILKAIERDRRIYVKNGEFETSSLIDFFVRTLRENPQMPNPRQFVIDEVEKYEIIDLVNLKLVIEQLRLYRKVTMHPLSHGTIGLTSFTYKELDHSLIILKKLEKQLSTLTSKRFPKDVAGM